jgi:phosphate transport system substrate-binding protein
MTLRISRNGAAALAVAAALGVAACGSSSSSSSSSSSGTPGASSSTSSSGSGTINGAGSTLAAPIYMQWGSTLQSQGITVNYNAAGSGTGVADLQSATVAFAGSDPAMKPTEIAAAKGPVAEFPIAFGGVTISYNLSSVKTGLKLDAPTIANIYLGKIQKWDDAAIKALNPGVTLPSTGITVVHRSDASGTTKAFATYLSDYSPAWTAAAGKPDKTVKWATGTGAKGNSGVAAAIKQTAGAIGYVEEAYALQQNFTFGAVKNKAGRFIVPNLATTSAAAVGIKIPPDLAISTIDSPNPSAYPIVSQTFLIVYKDMCKAGVSPSTAAAVKKFIAYGLSSAGQAQVKQLQYGPLPPGLLAKDLAQLKTLKCNGSPLP